MARSETAPPRLSKKGQGIPSFAGIGSYAERMLLHENSVVKIDDDLPLDLAALVGCGVLTGVGAARRSAGLEAGQTVAVFGCGGVGLSIVQGARIGGARQIIALDQFDSKLAMARRVGATQCGVGIVADHPYRNLELPVVAGGNRPAGLPLAPGALTTSSPTAPSATAVSCLSTMEQPVSSTTAIAPLTAAVP